MFGKGLKSGVVGVVALGVADSAGRDCASLLSLAVAYCVVGVAVEAILEEIECCRGCSGMANRDEVDFGAAAVGEAFIVLSELSLRT